jgi:intergrase/recombinase
VGQAIIDRRSRATIPSWGSHDLRRTAATEMAKLGLPLDLITTVLGQEAGGGETRVLRKHYIHNQFIDRKMHALAAWDSTYKPGGVM